MSKAQTLLQSTLSTLVLAGLAAGVTTGNAFAAKPGFEHCAGIAKAGKNDCGTSKHACAGQSVKDGTQDKEEWVYVPTGTCEKIAGGTVVKG